MSQMMSVWKNSQREQIQKCPISHNFKQNIKLLLPTQPQLLSYKTQNKIWNQVPLSIKSLLQQKLKLGEFLRSMRADQDRSGMKIFIYAILMIIYAKPANISQAKIYLPTDQELLARLQEHLFRAQATLETGQFKKTKIQWEQQCQVLLDDFLIYLGTLKQTGKRQNQMLNCLEWALSSNQRLFQIFVLAIQSIAAKVNLFESADDCQLRLQPEIIARLFQYFGIKARHQNGYILLDQVSYFVAFIQNYIVFGNYDPKTQNPSPKNDDFGNKMEKIQTETMKQQKNIVPWRRISSEDFSFVSQQFINQFAKVILDFDSNQKDISNETSLQRINYCRGQQFEIRVPKQGKKGLHDKDQQDDYIFKKGSQLLKPTSQVYATKNRSFLNIGHQSFGLSFGFSSCPLELYSSKKQSIKKSEGEDYAPVKANFSQCSCCENRIAKNALCSKVIDLTYEPHLQCRRRNNSMYLSNKTHSMIPSHSIIKVSPAKQTKDTQLQHSQIRENKVPAFLKSKKLKDSQQAVSQLASTIKKGKDNIKNQFSFKQLFQRFTGNEFDQRKTTKYPRLFADKNQLKGQELKQPSFIQKQAKSNPRFSHLITRSVVTQSPNKLKNKTNLGHSQTYREDLTNCSGFMSQVSKLAKARQQGSFEARAPAETFGNSSNQIQRRLTLKDNHNTHEMRKDFVSRSLSQTKTTTSDKKLTDRADIEGRHF